MFEMLNLFTRATYKHMLKRRCHIPICYRNESNRLLLTPITTAFHQNDLLVINPFKVIITFKGMIVKEPLIML